MKKLLTFAVVIIATLALTGIGLAANVDGDPVDRISIAASAVDASGYTLTMRVKGVTHTDPGVTSYVDQRTGDYNIDDIATLKGSIAYLYSTQSKWPGGKTMDDIDHENSEYLSKTVVDGPNATFEIKNKMPDVEYYYQPIVGLLVLTNHGNKHAALAHVGGSTYTCKNAKGQPQTWLKVNNKTNKIEPPGQEGCEEASQRN